MQLITDVWCHPGLWALCWLGWVEAEGWQKLPLGGWSERSRPPGRKDATVTPRQSGGAAALLPLCLWAWGLGVVARPPQASSAT